MLSIHLLGAPEILDEGQPLKLSRRKSRAVLYYLAAHSQPVSRESLLSIFWPDNPRPVAQQTLRTTLHGLRQVLGSALLAEGESVALESNVEVDVRLFENILSIPAPSVESLSEAVSLYRGDFLAGFSLPDSQSFEDWITIEREHYRRLIERAASLLSAAYETNQDYPAALDSLDRILAINPLQEDLQRESIRLAYLAGDRPDAIRRYDKLRRLLDEELGVPPMPETRALYDAILTDHLPLKPSPAQKSQPVHRVEPAAHQKLPAANSLPFHGRDAELRRLNDLAGIRKLILIEGEPGIGKTRLAEEYIQSSKALALCGRAHELEQTLPYHPIIEALRSLLKRPDWPFLQSGLRSVLPPVWLQETGRLLPEISAPAPGGQAQQRAADESRLWEGVNQFLNALARHQPVILFLDDLHWADASTLGLLGYLIRQPQSASITFLATAHTARSGSPLKSLLQSLIREDCLVRLPLSRLSQADILEIARALAPAAPHRLAEWLESNSEGNPYILAELIREAQGEDGQLVGEIVESPPVIPPNIYSLIESRLARLSDPARHFLDTAVAAGREFEFELIARAAGLSVMSALDALGELAAAGLVKEVDEKHFSFDHSLTMEVAYREIGDLRHRLLHRQIAEALISLYGEQAEDKAGLLAWHFSEGQDLKRAAPYALQAGQQAARLAAWTEAIALNEIALEGIEDRDRLPVWIALGEAHYKAGHFVQATEVLRDALHWAETNHMDAELSRIRLALGRSMIAQARFGEVMAIAQRVSQSGQRQDAMQAELLWGTALSLEGSDLEAAAEHLRAAESLCRSDESSQANKDVASLSMINFELGSVLAQQGDLHQAIAFYQKALAAASESDETVENRILAYNNLAYHMHLLGDPSASEYALKGLSLSEEKGFLGLQPYLLSTLGEIALVTQDLDQAEQFFSRGLAIAERLAMPERIAGLTANLGLVALQRGNIPLAIHQLSSALGKADSLGTRHLAAQIRLWLAPLLPAKEGRIQLAEARSFAQSSGRTRLLENAIQVEAELAAKAKFENR